MSIELPMRFSFLLKVHSIFAIMPVCLSTSIERFYDTASRFKGMEIRTSLRPARNPENGAEQTISSFEKFFPLLSQSPRLNSALCAHQISRTRSSNKDLQPLSACFATKTPTFETKQWLKLCGMLQAVLLSNLITQ